MPEAIHSIHLRKKEVRAIFWGLCALLWGLPLQGQVPTDLSPLPATSSQPPNWVLGFGLTGTAYYGDLNHSEASIFQSNFLSFYPGFNLNFHAGKARRISPEVNLGFGTMVGQNPDLPAVSLDQGDNLPPLLIQPNTYAETFFVYGDLGLRLNLVKRARLFQPYLGAGLGLLTFFPENERGLSLVRRRSTRAPSEANFEALTYSLPLTFGLDLNLSPRLGLNFAYTLRLPGTDYLDNIDRLGQQPGNDRLHILRVGANIRFQEQRSPSPPPAIRPLILTDSQAIAAQAPDPLPPFDEALGALVPANTLQQPDCDSLAESYEVQLAKLQGEKAGWQEQAYRLQQELIRVQKRSDSLQQALKDREQLVVENEVLKVKLKAYQDGKIVMADQRLNYLAMEAENGYLIGEVERLRKLESTQSPPPDIEELNHAALETENEWYAREIASLRRQIAKKQTQVWMDTIQYVDSVLAISRSEGLLVDISGYRVVLLTRKPDPVAKVKNWMLQRGFEGYMEEGNLMYDYISLKEVGFTTYQLQVDANELESGLNQLIIRFTPEIGRLPISSYLRESRKARDLIADIIR